VERTERGRINALKRLGERFITVTYKDVGEELLILSAVDKRDSNRRLGMKIEYSKSADALHVSFKQADRS
jgi:hypothetical protein